MVPRRAIALALLVPLAACGGVSKDDYADDLDDVCQDISQKTEEIGQAKVENPAQLSAQLEDIRSAIRSGIDRMKDIERPDGDDGDKAEEYVTKLEQTLNEQLMPALDDLEQAVRAKDRAKIQAAASRLQAVDEDETDKLAQDLGADECAEG